jgi:predicted component of viral defense system (DUF524 family)
MPELVRLQTPDFEFSIWANDISQRAKVYYKTLNSRAVRSANGSGNSNCNQEAINSDLIQNNPTSTLRFSPAIDLVNLNIIQVQGQKYSSPQNLNDHTPDSIFGDARGKKCVLTLPSPLFFENTQYQFEWVFFGGVTGARLVHRSQHINEAFRFVPELRISKGFVPARLTGTISTGNYLGWMRLPMEYELDSEIHTQQIAFEVLPTKMELHQDLMVMYRDIDNVYPLWRFSFVEKTEQSAASSNNRGYFPIMWLANFTAIRERFEKGLRVICAAPHSRLQSTVTNIKAAKLKGKLPQKLIREVKQDFDYGQYDRRYRVERKQLSLDTPENRFIKMVISHCKRHLSEFEAKLRQSNNAPEHQRLSDAFLNELHDWQQPLQKVLTHSFLNDVGPFNGLSRESLVLQQKTGYSTVYRIWQELKFYLDVLGNQSSISMKSVAEIYEVWCFLCLKQILVEDLGFELVENNAAKLIQNDFFEYQMKDGFAGAFQFKRVDGVTARLAHEPKFTKRGHPIRTFLVNQEPDIVLEVSLPKRESSDEEKQFIWLFDAKYRIKTDNNRFDDSVEDDIEITDYVPDDAINQMHRYRDALIRMSESQKGSAICKDPNKSRPVFGAFALYPGFFNQATYQNPYGTAINEVGIGAFALLPSQADYGYSGHKWLLDFLQAQIGLVPNKKTIQGDTDLYSVEQIAERLYAQEAARIPNYGMRQVLYPDLTMTVSLGGQADRDLNYFKAFEDGTAKWYHIPKSTFLQKFKQHVAEEIRYLAIARNSTTDSSSKQIDKLWPINRVTLLPRNAITDQQTGRKSESTELFYLFELGKPLTLQVPITDIPYRSIKESMKLTTLTRLDRVSKFNELETVYDEALSIMAH